MFSRIVSAFQSKHVQLNELKNAAIITLNRPEKMNTFTPEMPDQLFNIIKDLESSDKSHVMIQGVGKAFSAGLDLKEILSVPENEVVRLNVVAAKSMDLIANYRKPYVALIDGICMGGGCYYSLSAKFRIATERTIYAMPEAEIGFFTNAGASFTLPRLKYNVGFYIALAGARLYGYDAKKFGLATHFVESKRVEELKRSLAACDGESEVARTIAKFSSVPNDLHSDLDEVLAAVDKCFDGDTVEEIVDNLHLNGSEWAMRTVRMLNKMSPTSLKVCHRLLVLGKRRSLRECLQMEHALTYNWMRKFAAEFEEGVRALIVEKDLKPQWRPKALPSVKEEDLQEVFAAVPEKFALHFENEKAKL